MKISTRLLHVNKLAFFLISCVALFFLQAALLKQGFRLRLVFFDIPSFVVLFSVASLKILSHDERGLDKSIFRFVYRLLLMVFDCQKDDVHREVVNFFRLVMWFFFSSMLSWVAVLLFNGRW